MSDNWRILQNTFHYPSWQKIWKISEAYTTEILQAYEKLYLKTIPWEIPDCLKSAVLFVMQSFIKKNLISCYHSAFLNQILLSWRHCPFYGWWRLKSFTVCPQKYHFHSREQQRWNVWANEKNSCVNMAFWMAIQQNGQTYIKICIGRSTKMTG